MVFTGANVACIVKIKIRKQRKNEMKNQINKNVVKVLAIGMSTSMALQPVVAFCK